MTDQRRIIWVDASMASVHLLWTYSAQVPPATIRQWGQRHPGIRTGAGKYRYDLEAVVAHARNLGLLEDR